MKKLKDLLGTSACEKSTTTSDWIERAVVLEDFEVVCKKAFCATCNGTGNKCGKELPDDYCREFCKSCHGKRFFYVPVEEHNETSK